VSYSEQVLRDGPLAYYRLGEPAGATEAFDSSPNARHGTYDAAARPGAPGATSDGDTALEIVGDGTTTAGRVVLPLLLSGLGAWSFECWVRPRAGAVEDPFVGLVGGDNYPRVTWSSIARTINMGTRSASGAWSHGPTFPLPGLDRWYHVVAVGEGASSSSPRMHLFVDGTHVGSSVHEEPFRDPVQAVGIGSRDGAVALDGRIDEVAVYDRALTAEEVSRHYAAR
jgi:hypothetical protein